MAGKKRRKWSWILGIIALIALVALLLVRCDGQQGDIPTLCIASPQKLAPDTKEFLLDVTVSDLGEALYPAMSMRICFDSSRLEFLGVEEGNLFVLSSENSNGRQLPQWSCDIENSNATGVINVMYLDMTSGKNAFTKALLADDDNVVLRLKLRLRGSCRPGDVLDLILEDAVFAASDEAQSLAMTTGTLKTRNGKLVIGG